jgi:hypothetical protein
MNRDSENNASFLKKFDAGIDVGGTTDTEARTHYITNQKLTYFYINDKNVNYINAHG